MYADNRQKLALFMREACDAAGCAYGVVLMRAGLSGNRNDTDHELLFRQESYFSYLFGVDEPDWWGVIDVATGNCTMFIPKLPAEYAIWMGEIMKPPAFRERYAVEDCQYINDLKAWLAAQEGPVHTMKGVNTDSGTDIKDVLPATEMTPEGKQVRDGGPAV